MRRDWSWLCLVWLLAAPLAAQDDALTPPTLREEGALPPPFAGSPRSLTWLLQLDVDGSVLSAQLVEPAEASDRDAVRALAEPYVLGLHFSPAQRNGVAVQARIRFQHRLEPAPLVALRPPARSAPPREPEPTPEFGASAAVEAPLQATSALNLAGKSLRRRPYFNAGDLLNGAPGFYVVQHGGGGKAQQYFLRGFDADHGTDVALFVDDVPVNLPTHGHGQGYSDLNWIIPELVETIEVRKGPFFAELGDHAVAGAVNYRLRNDLPQSFVTGTVGMFDSYRGVAIAKLSERASAPLFAAEIYRTDGPFTHPEDYRRLSLFSRGTERWGKGRVTWSAQSFLSAWNASGQIPQRAVDSGAISRFGSLDPAEGGASQRHSLSVDYRRKTSPDAEVRVTAWLARNRLTLYSDFSFFTDDPIDGDMIQQVDDRVYSGVRAQWQVERQYGGLRVLARAGTQWRYDHSDPRVSRAPGRLVRGRVTASAVDEAAGGLFAELDARYARWLRVVAGVRYDALLVQVEDRVRDEGQALRSGERFAELVSPKLSLIFHAHDYLDLYTNVGSGYHSNDARGLVRRGDARVDPFARALAYELGARVAGSTRFMLSWSGYLLDLASEVVFVGDDGSSEPRGKTRRLGTELTGMLALCSWLKWDGSVSYSHAAFVDNAGNADSVALAPRWLLQSGLEAEHTSGLAGRLSLLFIGDRPATEDGFLVAQGFTRLDLTAEYKREWYGLSVSVQNLTDAVYRSAQFASTTRLRGETDASSCARGTRAVEEQGAFQGCEDITFTPGLPITVLGSASLYF